MIPTLAITDLVQHTPVGDHVGCIAGHEQNFHAGVKGLHPFRQIPTVHFWQRQNHGSSLSEKFHGVHHPSSIPSCLFSPTHVLPHGHLSRQRSAFLSLATKGFKMFPFIFLRIQPLKDFTLALVIIGNENNVQKRERATNHVANKYYA